MVTEEQVMTSHYDLLTNYDMLCPVCRTRLVPGERLRYETLDEHVCNPNGKSPVRITFVCPKETCEAHVKEVFWANDGEGPYMKNYRDECAWQDGNPVPFNSYHRASYFAISYHDEDRKFRWGKLCILREVHYESNAFGEKVGERVKYRIIWDNVYWTSGFHKFLYLLRCFYGGHHTRDDRVWQAQDIIERAQPHGYYKPKWWRKAARWWIRIFHLDIYQKAAQEVRR
jgi:hypothetical protein